MGLGFSDLRQRDAREVRDAIRCGSYTRHTAGLAEGKLQANLVILREDEALDFMRFCQRNPKPCPLVGVTDTGDPYFRTLGQDIDVRRDIPSYNIYRDGQMTEQRTDIAEFWQDDMVAFALGCSFTFENALEREGIPVWHIQNDTTVPMFLSNIPLVSAGPFGGEMVVSMRAIAKDRVEDAIRISAQFPHAHGAPVHVGDPVAIGISDAARPDWGDPAPVGEGEVPVFWACGVTPQAAVMRAKLPFVITHTPGHMLISDVPEDAETPVLLPD
ncbi:MAG: putative hydro-lyase [Rhodobacteraceae bacterium]|nr:putative hydro-lyase [Paracoccaceae bacterium]